MIWRVLAKARELLSMQLWKNVLWASIISLPEAKVVTESSRCRRLKDPRVYEEVSAMAVVCSPRYSACDINYKNTVQGQSRMRMQASVVISNHGNTLHEPAFDGNCKVMRVVHAGAYGCRTGSRERSLLMEQDMPRVRR